MKAPRRRSLIVIGVTLVVAAAAVIGLTSGPDNPKYNGKNLSTWLDELSALGHPKDRDPTTEQAKAIRAIGTNGIPWLLHDLGTKGNALYWRCNQVLKKQGIIKYRFPEAHDRLRRACLGFHALGESAASAIPDLLKLVEVQPGYVPSALAGVGRPAIPALQQCLTNLWSCDSSVGKLRPIPGNTIGAIHNATRAGRLSKDDATIFLPAVREWAQSTNRNPSTYNYATDFLKDFDR